MKRTNTTKDINNNIIQNIVSDNIDIKALESLQKTIDGLMLYAIESEQQKIEEQQKQNFVDTLNDDVFNINIVKNIDSRMSPYRVYINYRDMEVSFNYDGISTHLELRNLYEGTTSHGIAIYQTDRKHALTYSKKVDTCRRLHYRIINEDMKNFEEFIFKCAALVIDNTLENYQVKFNQIYC